MIECISYFVHYIQGCWRHILFIFLTWTVLDSASCALWKIFFQKDIHKYIQTNEIMTPDMVQVRTWPIFVGDQAMRTYGNFEGFPYNSALFRLAISWPLWYRNDIQQNLRWCSKSAVASAWRLLLVPPTFLDLHDVETPAFSWCKWCGAFFISIFAACFGQKKNIHECLWSGIWGYHSPVKNRLKISPEIQSTNTNNHTHSNVCKCIILSAILIDGHDEYWKLIFWVLQFVLLCSKKRRCRDKLRFRTRTRKGVFSKEAPIAAQVLQT